jgi:hypothetical protein
VAVAEVVEQQEQTLLVPYLDSLGHLVVHMAVVEVAELNLVA